MKTLRKLSDDAAKYMKIFFKKELGAILLLSSIIAVNLFFGLPRLDKYSAVDEPYWTYDRTSKFWSGVTKPKFSRTNINDKPGVTVAIFSGLGLLKYDPMDYKTLRQKPKTSEQLEIINSINFFFRLPIYLLSLLFLPLFYFFIRKMFGKSTANFSTIFIGLSPILLGMSLIINPDSLIWIFAPLALLSFLAYLKEDKFKFSAIAGIFLGLSLLTKYVSNVLYVYFFLLIFIDFIFAAKQTEFFVYLRNKMIGYLILIASSLATFFIFFPAVWVKPIMLLEGTFLNKTFVPFLPLFCAILFFIGLDFFFLKSKIIKTILEKITPYRKTLVLLFLGFFLFLMIAVIVNVYSGMRFGDFMQIIASPKGTNDLFSPAVFSGKILAEVYSLIFAVSPLVLVSVISYITALIVWHKEKDIYAIKNVFYFLLFIFIYYIASTASGAVAVVRYQVMLYPLFFIIAGMALAHFVQIKRFEKHQIIISILFAFSLIYSLVSIKPFYFAYNSEILPKKYVVNLKDMGDGSYEAAAYLNSLPNPQNLVIWSDKGAVCAVFSGRCEIGLDPKNIKGKDFDYIVISTGRMSKTFKTETSAKSYIDLEQAYLTEDYAFKVEIAGRPDNFVKVVDAKQLLIME
ncbi:MAG: Uncharacterized protein Athens071425_540 [Parcubacteria group bacterium Athens0714_25]|nr:MAG: Uncharacterized protein Athens071425_540 [Parcubacteria group bacterium Athens0714_25]